MTGWISRAGWGLAHVLRPNSTHQLRGVEYARTRCGRKVRADQVTSAGYGDRCKRCDDMDARHHDTCKSPPPPNPAHV